MLKSTVRVATKGPLLRTRWKPWRARAHHVVQAMGVSRQPTIIVSSSCSHQQHRSFRHN